MSWPRIVKAPGSLRVAPNLSDCQAACASFSWEAARRRGGVLRAPEADYEKLATLAGAVAVAYLGAKSA